MASSGVHVTSSANGSSTAASSTVVVVEVTVAIAIAITTITPACEPQTRLGSERTHRTPADRPGAEVFERRVSTIAADETKALETR